MLNFLIFRPAARLLENPHLEWNAKLISFVVFSLGFEHPGLIGGWEILLSRVNVRDVARSAEFRGQRSKLSQPLKLKQHSLFLHASTFKCIVTRLDGLLLVRPR